jgi:hypothetical protein
MGCRTWYKSSFPEGKPTLCHREIKQAIINHDEMLREGWLAHLTWECSSCGKERPDKFISVYVHKHEMNGLGEVTHNLKYCNDNPACEELAKKCTGAFNDQDNS